MNTLICIESSTTSTTIERASAKKDKKNVVTFLSFFALTRSNVDEIVPDSIQIRTFMFCWLWTENSFSEGSITYYITFFILEYLSKDCILNLLFFFQILYMMDRYLYLYKANGANARKTAYTKRYPLDTLCIFTISYKFVPRLQRLCHAPTFVVY